MTDEPKLPPYGKWRNGRPRFHPSARELALGFEGEDLRHKDGRWFTFEEAWAWLIARHAEIVQARTGGRKRRQQSEAARRNTVADLLKDWLAALEQRVADKVDPISPDTVVSYRKAAAALLYTPETREQRAKRRAKEKAATLLGLEKPTREMEQFAKAPVAAIGKIELNDMFLYLVRVRGHHMAQAAIAAFSAAYTWGGLDRRWRLGHNPRHELDLPRPEGRIVIYSDAEIRALVAAGDVLGRPSIGDSIYLGLFTAQRQRDRLRLKDEGLVDGRRQFRQSKTKRRLVPIKETPQLAARLADARKRVNELVLRLGLRPEQRPDTIVVDETTGREYDQDTYRHVFAEVRAAAIAGIVDEAATAAARANGRNDPEPIWLLPPCPSLVHVRDDGSTTLKQDLDLRDTSITWLARADNTMAEICAISGHSPASVQTIISHYLGATRELADTGIDKLVAWMQREGIAV